MVGMRYLLYNVLLLVASPVILLILLTKQRCRRGLFQRIGWVPKKLDSLPSPVMWIHAVSLGEVLAVVPLVKALQKRYPHWSFLVSTVTETGREAVEQRLSGVAEHCYLPLDFPWAVNAYVTRCRPSAFLFVETELWPNLLKCFARYGIPTILVNGRLSSRSFQRYRLIKGFMTQMLSFVEGCLMQSERDAQRIRDLGASPDIVYRTGNMKFDQDLGSQSLVLPQMTRSVLGLLEDEELIVAGSTHSEEEDQLLQCYTRLHQAVPASVLLLAPRHIERVASVEAKVQAHNLNCVRRSNMKHGYTGSSTSGTPRVIILDTRGELAQVYALGRVAFVGGTLVPIGGHNLLEPAQWEIPVFFGPYTDHCTEVVRLLVQSGGGVQVQDADELFAKILQVFQDPSMIRQMGAAAGRVVKENQGVVNRNLELIVSLIEERYTRTSQPSSLTSECIQGQR